MSARGETRIYVGNLPRDADKRDVADLFSKYGRVSYVSLKTGRGRPFAFVKFDDYKDAEDAVYGRNGYNFDGSRLRVEFPRNRVPRRRGRRSDYRVIISNLPETGSWQDLKDHMREAGEICHANVFKDCTGVIEYDRYVSMVYAVKKLDDTLFTSHKGDTSYIRVKEDFRRSRSPRKRRTPSYSPIRRSISKSRSRSCS